MTRIIIIVVLSVIAFVQSGCDKIKTELERRHLGSEPHNAAPPAQSNPLKTFHVKRNDTETPLERKQIVLRIDFPSDEKIQIRLIKNLNSAEELKSVVLPPQNEALKESVSPKEDHSSDKPENTVESEKKKQSEPEAIKDKESQSEIKPDSEQEPQPEMKTGRDEDLQASASAHTPTIVVPAKETTTPVSPDANERLALSQLVKSNSAPSEAAVGSALTVTPPSAILPGTDEKLNAVPEGNKPSLSNRWSIPNTEYPLRYY